MGISFASSVNDNSTDSSDNNLNIQHNTNIEKYTSTQKNNDLSSNNINSTKNIIKKTNASSEVSVKKEANQTQTLPTKHIYVKSTANNSLLYGTAKNPYTTIELAINKSAVGYNNIIHITAGTYTISPKIIINKTITLIGSNRNKTIINCNYNQAFRVKNYANLTLENLTFQNANYSQGGVILLSEGSKLVINECNFKKNKANNGGVLFASANKIHANITNSIFDSNTAVRFGAALQMGGFDSVYNIVNCTFIKNKLTDKDYSHSTGGAAIYASSYSTVNVENSVFKNNEAIWGCAILNGNHATLKVKNSKFTSNIAEKNIKGSNKTKGGAIAIGSGYAEITDCYFENNQADVGGAISINSGEKSLISSCLFQKNIAYFEAGAINNYGALTLKNNSFIKNSADNYGGALVDIGLSNIVVDKCTFKNNRVSTSKAANGITPSGGAIYIKSATPHFTIKNTLFDHNSAYYGGAIFSHNKVQWVTLTNNKFNNNTACYGGAMYVIGETMFDVDKTTFTYNRALRRGGSILVSATAQLNFANTKFSGNVANQSNDGYGGAVYVNSYSRLCFENCQLENNYANIYGGAIYASTSVNMRIISSNMTNNTATKGSVVFLNNSATYKKVNSQIVVDTSSFVNNNGKYVMYSVKAYNATCNNNLLRTNWWGSNNVPTNVTYNFKLLNHHILQIKINDFAIDTNWIKNDVTVVVNRTTLKEKNLIVSLTTIKEGNTFRYTDAFLPTRKISIKENNKKETNKNFYVHYLIDKSLNTVVVKLDNQKITIKLVN